MQLRNVTNTTAGQGVAKPQSPAAASETMALDLSSFAQAEAVEQAIVESRGSGHLDLTGLTLKKVPIEVYDLVVVISLTLDSNELNSLPTELSRLILLQELSASCNRIASFPAVVFELTALTRLDLSYNQLMDLGDGTAFRPLKSLRELNLANNSLVTLPEEISQLTALEDLHLEGNLLKALPPLGSLKQLNALVAYDNKLQCAPRGLPGSLQFIDLSRNDILDLGGSNICSIGALRTLDLSSNRITELPRFRSPHLEELAVADNRLESLSSLEDLPELRVLDASRNQLRALPFSIGALQQLTEVHLRNNYLESLPPSMGMCQQLRMLDVSDNKLESLPEEMGQISTLTHLKFRHNSLNWVPVKLADLPHLQELDLFNNRKISNLPAELTKEETPAKAVLRYLSSLVGENAIQPALMNGGGGNMNAVAGVGSSTPASSYKTPRIARVQSSNNVHDEEAISSQDPAETSVEEVHPGPPQRELDKASWNVPTWLVPALAGAGAMLMFSWLSSRRRKI